MAFANDYRHMLDVLANRRPRRLPAYEQTFDQPALYRCRVSNSPAATSSISPASCACG